MSYYQARFKRGTKLVAYGKWEWDTRRNTFALKLAKPDELEILPSDDESGIDVTLDSKKNSEEIELEEDRESPALAMIHAGRRVPVYRKLGPFGTKRLREVVFSVLEKLDPDTVQESLPAGVIKECGLLSRAQAIKQIHFPDETSSLVDYAAWRSPAHHRLIFEEFFKVSFALQLKRGHRSAEPKGAKIKITEKLREKISARLPFALTQAQERVEQEIFSDMESESPMNRLVQGDVGSGKTVVALMAIMAAVENGYQAALMAPTEILAEQHLRSAEKFFDGTGHTPALLTGSMKAAEKKKRRADIATGSIDVVIGTHAIIQEGVEFRNLGLAVVDEQHRFGVLQRGQLKDAGLNPDILVMTATPIPRSLAMTVYGDLDVSIIDELPPGRTPVKTVVVGEDQREGVYKGIRREVSQGRQVYIVYPLVEESEKMDLKAATAMFEELRDRQFSDLRIGLLHGRMKSLEKDEVMKAFKAGDLDILVSTTVIEVGVDVPNATLMIIEHAERFGLSQLHQLRGRVGRGSDKSFCVLLTGDRRTVTARERLGIMEETNDGFKISEKDLEIRGQGDILGTRQAGLQMFKVGNIVRDFELLSKAKESAEKFLELGPNDRAVKDLIRSVESDPRFELIGIG
jgi:ATP-dependent DNA helicase RecG